MTEDSLPPLPSIGELIHQFGLSVGDLGDAAAGRDDKERRRREALRKRLHRIAEGGDMRAEDCRALINDLIRPLEARSPSFGSLLGDWACSALDAYRTLLPDLECGSLSRAHVLPVLAAHIFLPMAAGLVRELGAANEAERWANGDRPATAQVLDRWIAKRGLSRSGFASDHAARRAPFQPEQLASLRANIYAWINGRPVDVRSVLHFHDGANDRLADLLLIARAFDRFREAIPAASHERLRRVWRARLLMPADHPDPEAINKELREIALADGRNPAMMAFVRENAEIAPLTDPRTQKREGNSSQAAAILDRMASTNPVPELDWLICLHRARHQVLMGEYEAAVELYETAFAGARYRSGKMTRVILNELLIVAVFLGRRPDGKPWTDWAEAMGLTPAVRDPVYAYLSLFPPNAHYPEAGNPRLTAAIKSMKGRYAVVDTDWANTRLDHRNKDRQRKGFGRIPKTELMIHAARRDAKKVAALIEHGADVNAVAADNSTALMHALGSWSRECIDLILPRCTAETVNRVTREKGNSAMGIAVEQGDPDLVARLIAAGADVGLGYGELGLSPLYDAVRRYCGLGPSLAHMLTDEALKSALKHARPLPDVYAHALLDDQIQAMRERLAGTMSTARGRMILQAVVEHYRGGPSAERWRIIELLLDAGADPNEPMRNWHDFTAFLLTAEFSDVPLFELLRNRGGNLRSVTAQGQTALWLATWKGQWEMARRIQSVATPEEATFLAGHAETVHGTRPIHWVVMNGGIAEGLVVK